MTEGSLVQRRHLLLIAAILIGLAFALMAPVFRDAVKVSPPPPRIAETAASGPAATGSLAEFFPIGVWVPPVADFAKWKERGVNTVVEVPQGHDLEEWTAGARLHDLRMVRAPRPIPEDDQDEELLLAWLFQDEPDLRRTSAASLLELYRAWKAADAERPVLVNFSGGYVLNLQGNCDASCYQSYIEATDWVSNDIYPVTGWNRPGSLDWVGRAIGTLRELSGDRPQFAFIETSDQHLPDGPRDARGVTPGELRAEIWTAIIAGARGIWYFSPSFDPFRFDATPPKVVEELVRQNATITGLGPVLQGEINPGSVGVRVRSPLQVTWRSSPSSLYGIVLNAADSPRTDQVILLEGVAASSAVVYGEDRTVPIIAGVIRDDFDAHGVHIYVIERTAAVGGG